MNKPFILVKFKNRCLSQSRRAVYTHVSDAARGSLFSSCFLFISYRVPAVVKSCL